MYGLSISRRLENHEQFLKHVRQTAKGQHFFMSGLVYQAKLLDQIPTFPSFLVTVSYSSFPCFQNMVKQRKCHSFG